MFASNPIICNNKCQIAFDFSSAADVVVAAVDIVVVLTGRALYAQAQTQTYACTHAQIRERQSDPLSQSVVLKTRSLVYVLGKVDCAKLKWSLP